MIGDRPADPGPRSLMGRIGAIRLGRVEGEYVVLPTSDELKESDLDLVVASTSQRIVMIEGFGQEVARARDAGSHHDATGSTRR